MIARMPNPTPVDGDDVLAVLDQRLRELQVRRDVITDLIIGLEKTAVARSDVSEDVVRAEALLGGEKVVHSRERPISQLATLHGERDLIDKALKIGRSRQHRLAAERAGEIWANHFAEIAEMEKRRVLLAIELQKVNRDRERLRERITAAGGAGFLSTDSADLLGLGDQGDCPVRWSAERLIADGIATRAEIDRASKD